MLPGELARAHFGVGFAGVPEGVVTLGELGDLDGDGHAEHAVGIPVTDGVGRARIFSSATGDLLRTLRSDVPGDGFGWSLANAGDVDADGRDDVIVGAPGDDTVAPDAGAAHVFSGRTGEPLYTLVGAHPDERLGTAVGGLGDVDGDGRSDVFVTCRDDAGVGWLRAYSSGDRAGATGPAEE